MAVSGCVDNFNVDEKKGILGFQILRQDLFKNSIPLALSSNIEGGTHSLKKCNGVDVNVQPIFP